MNPFDIVKPFTSVYPEKDEGCKLLCEEGIEITSSNMLGDPIASGFALQYFYMNQYKNKILPSQAGLFDDEFEDLDQDGDDEAWGEEKPCEHKWVTSGIPGGKLIFCKLCDCDYNQVLHGKVTFFD